VILVAQLQFGFALPRPSLRPSRFDLIDLQLPRRHCFANHSASNACNRPKSNGTFTSLGFFT